MRCRRTRRGKAAYRPRNRFRTLSGGTPIMFSVTPGVYNITATPFDESGELDLESLRTLVDFQLARGVTGLTILGNLGEVRYLTDAERDTVLKTTMAQVAGRV